MKKLFFLMVFAISTQSFADFEKDVEGDYLLWSEDEKPTDLFNYIAKRQTAIDDKVGDKKYKILVTIAGDDLDLLYDLFLNNQIVCVSKSQQPVLDEVYKVIHYKVYTNSLDCIPFSLKILQIGFGYMHYNV
jgi:hypothetical protein